MQPPPKTILVIGAGVAGLASAIRLARKGYDVTVVEAGPGPGGKLNEVRGGGYRFDAGPSLFTLPALMEDLLGKPGWSEQYCIRVDPVTSYFWNDGHRVDAWTDANRFDSELAAKNGETPGQVKRYLDECRQLYDLTSDLFLFSGFLSFKTLFSFKALKVLIKTGKLKAFHSLHHENRKWFKHPRSVQLFDRFATYNGSDPYRAPATLRMIPHLEHNIGAYFPKEGMYSLARQMHEEAVSLGVRFYFNTRAEEIILESKAVKGVRTSGGYHTVDRVVSDSDIASVYGTLLPKHPLKSKWKQGELSSSALIFYWGVKGQFPQLGLHNVLFADNYRQEFESIRHHTMADDLTVYIYISSKASPGDAPAGGENWFVMVNAPPDYGQNWDEIRSRVRNGIFSKLRKVLGEDIAPLIEFESYLDPPAIAHKTASYRGALYGLSSNSRFSAFARHPNQVSAFRNLYFVGGSVHPGGGIPLCLSSAKIACSLIPDVKTITS